MSMQLTPSGIGQAAMLGCVALGGIILFDAYGFYQSGAGILNDFNIHLLVEERVRLVFEIFVGIGLILFGAGVYTIAIGAIGIITALSLSAGMVWAYNDNGTAARPDSCVTIAFGETEKAWCLLDDDQDGTINWDETAGSKRNCDSQTYRKCQ